MPAHVLDSSTDVVLLHIQNSRLDHPTRIVLNKMYVHGFSGMIRTSHQFTETLRQQFKYMFIIIGICVPIVNHYCYENQNSIPMQISPIVLTLASTSDLRQNTKQRNVLPSFIKHEWQTNMAQNCVKNEGKGVTCPTKTWSNNACLNLNFCSSLIHGSFWKRKQQLKRSLLKKKH